MLKKLGISLLLFTMLFSCSLGNNKLIQSSDLSESIEPISVNIKDSIEDIKSYSTDVTIYTGNNRNIDGITQSGSYRLSMKEIDGEVFTRIDFPSEMFTDGIARTSLANSEELFLFQTSNNKLEQRVQLNFPDVEYKDIFTGYDRLQLRGKIENFSSLEHKMYDISENTSIDNKNLKVKLPQNNGVDFSLTFDIENEVLLETNSIEIDSDGNEISTKIQFVYQEVEGELLKIGQVMETVYDIKEEINAEDYELPIIDSEDELEIMTQEEIDKIEEEGGLIYEVEPILGDPSDLDYTETNIELYSDLSINTEDDSLFKIIW